MARLDTAATVLREPARPASAHPRSSGNGSVRRVWRALALAGICGVLFFYGLNAGDLHRAEGLRALVAREFLRTGNWIVPKLYGEPLLTKPPAMYAAIALASWPAGAPRWDPGRIFMDWAPPCTTC